MSLFATFDHGIITLLAAALIAVDVSAVHQQSPLFHITRGLKFWYPLCSSSFSIALIISSSIEGFRKTWIVIRIVITIIWLSEWMEELKRWKIKAIKTAPVPGVALEDFWDEDSEAAQYSTGSLFHGDPDISEDES
jgi:hypothetical protein